MLIVTILNRCNLLSVGQNTMRVLFIRIDKILVTDRKINEEVSAGSTIVRVHGSLCQPTQEQHEALAPRDEE